MTTDRVIFTLVGEGEDLSYKLAKDLSLLNLHFYLYNEKKNHYFVFPSFKPAFTSFLALYRALSSQRQANQSLQGLAI